MLVVTPDSFSGIISLPFVSKDNSFGGSIIESLQESNLIDYINIYEKEYLILVLGKKLYRRVGINISQSKILYKPNYGVTKRYESLIKLLKGNRKKYSAVACYVFCKLVQNNIVKMTATGVVLPNATDGTNKEDNTKVVQAWNEQVARTKEVYEHLIKYNKKFYKHNIKEFNICKQLLLPINMFNL